MNFPAGILFDLDDTLYDYRLYRRSGFRAVARSLHQRTGLELGALFRKLLEIDTCHAPFHPKAIDELLLHFRLSPRLLKESVAVFRTHDPQISLFAGVRSLLVDLTVREGVPLFLVTEGHPYSQEMKIRSLGIRDFFRRIFVLGPPLRHKRQPQTYEEICRILSAPPSSLWVVGDNPVKDFFIPARMGMTLVHVAKAGSQKEDSPYECLRIPSTSGLLSLMDPTIYKGGVPCTATG
jgi:FMN phosphatase YigB (HAD superfamily)